MTQQLKLPKVQLVREFGDGGGCVKMNGEKLHLWQEARFGLKAGRPRRRRRHRVSNAHHFGMYRQFGDTEPILEDVCDVSFYYIAINVAIVVTDLLLRSHCTLRF